MNKRELIEKVTEESGLLKITVEDAVTSMLSVISESLEKGEEVSLTGLGKIQVIEKKERVGRNPQTGEPLVIPTKRTIRWKTSSVLKELLNGD